MKIFDHLISGGPSIFYDPNFRVMIEDHLTYLKNLPENTVIEVTPGHSYKHARDFYGLLMEYSVLPHHHWITMRVNDMVTPFDYKDDMLSFVRVDDTSIERLRSTYMSQRKIKK